MSRADHRRDVIVALEQALNALDRYLEAAEPHVLPQLAGIEPTLRELRNDFTRATRRCDHVRGPHGSALHVRCLLTEGHDGPHDFGDVRGVS